MYVVRDNDGIQAMIDEDFNMHKDWIARIWIGFYTIASGITYSLRIWKNGKTIYEGDEMELPTVLSVLRETINDALPTNEIDYLESLKLQKTMCKK